MMTDAEMTDAQVADQIERADRFIADFRERIAATVVDPASACADYQRHGLQRIADTLDACGSRSCLRWRRVTFPAESWAS